MMWMQLLQMGQTAATTQKSQAISALVWGRRKEHCSQEEMMGGQKLGWKHSTPSVLRWKQAGLPTTVCLTLAAKGTEEENCVSKCKKRRPTVTPAIVSTCDDLVARTKQQQRVGWNKGQTNKQMKWKKGIAKSTGWNHSKSMDWQMRTANQNWPIGVILRTWLAKETCWNEINWLECAFAGFNVEHKCLHLLLRLVPPWQDLHKVAKTFSS
jgi:hypothetical protein